MKVQITGKFLSGKKNEKGNMMKVKLLQEDRVEYLTAFDQGIMQKLENVKTDQEVTLNLNVYNKDYKGKTYLQAIVESVK